MLGGETIRMVVLSLNLLTTELCIRRALQVFQDLTKDENITGVQILACFLSLYRGLYSLGSVEYHTVVELIQQELLLILHLYIEHDYL